MRIWDDGDRVSAAMNDFVALGERRYFCRALIGDLQSKVAIDVVDRELIGQPEDLGVVLGVF